MYLLVLDNNRIFGTHISITTITFNNNNPIYTPFPTNYGTGDTVKVMTMLRDIKLEYLKNDENNNNNVVEFKASSVLLSNETVNTSLVVPSYFNNADSKYSIRYLLVIIDESIMLRDYYYTSIISPEYSANSIYYVLFILPLPVLNVLHPLNTYISGGTGLKYTNNR